MAGKFEASLVERFLGDRARDNGACCAGKSIGDRTIDGFKDAGSVRTIRAPDRIREACCQRNDRKRISKHSVSRIGCRFTDLEVDSQSASSRRDKSGV